MPSITRQKVCACFVCTVKASTSWLQVLHVCALGSGLCHVPLLLCSWVLEWCWGPCSQWVEVDFSALHLAPVTAGSVYSGHTSIRLQSRRQVEEGNTPHAPIAVHYRVRQYVDGRVDLSTLMRTEFMSILLGQSNLLAWMHLFVGLGKWIHYLCFLVSHLCRSVSFYIVKETQNPYRPFTLKTTSAVWTMHHLGTNSYTLLSSTVVINSTG